MGMRPRGINSPSRVMVHHINSCRLGVFDGPLVELKIIINPRVQGCGNSMVMFNQAG